MKDKIKTTGLNNPESYVLKHARFITYVVPLFTDLNKAQIYKKPYRDSPYHETELIKRFDYLHLFRSNEHTEDYYIRKPKNENFLFKNEDKIFIHVGKKLFSFETNDEVVKYSSENGYNDIKYPYAYGGKNIYFMLHQKDIPLQEYETSTVKNEYYYLYKKDEELKGNNEGFVENGNDSINCEIFHCKQSIHQFISSLSSPT